MSNQDKQYTTRATCRICNSNELYSVYSLGEQYVSGFVDAEEVCSGVRCPIDLVLCKCCTLVQQLHTVSPEILHAGGYWYKSSVTQTMRDALADVCRAGERAVGGLQPGDVVLDIGSNDGTLLRSYSRLCHGQNIIKVGCEPSANLWDEGFQGIDHLICGSWSSGAYLEQVPDQAKIVTAIGMLYDLEDPNRFIRDVARVLHPEGVFIAQFMGLQGMLRQGDVGNLCHEHLEFYSLRSLNYLLCCHGLEIYDLEVNPVNGESYRIYVRHFGSRAGLEPPSKSVQMTWPLTPLPPAGRRRIDAALDAERDLSDLGKLNARFYQMEGQRDACVEFVKEQAAQGKRIWVLGASTKGNVWLQWSGLDRTILQGASERSPAKWGKCTVGIGIPICSEEDARAARPDWFLVLPYPFLSEIVQREWDAGYHGGFIVPMPHLQVIPPLAEGAAVPRITPLA